MKAILVALMVVVLSGATQAAHPVTKRNCKNDYFRYCSHTQPGTPEIRVCFRHNFKRLVASCQWAIKKYERRKGE